jgi:hypothetical protein
MNTLPTSPEEWGNLWPQTQLPCSGDSCCAGFGIFEHVRKAFATQRPGEQETHPLGLLLTDLAVDHGACIGACLKDEALDAFCSDLSRQPNSTLGLAAAAFSKMPTAVSSQQPATSCTCGRQSCRGGRRCETASRRQEEKQPCSCGRKKCAGGRRCPMKNQRPGDQDGNGGLMRNSLEAVLHGCDDMPAIGSELLLAHARQKAQGVDVRGLFITGLAGTCLAVEGTPKGTANLTGTTHPAYMLAGEWRQAQARRRSLPALH